MKRFYKLTTLNTLEEIKAIDAKLDNGGYNPLDFTNFVDYMDEFERSLVFDISETESIFILSESMLGKAVAYLSKFGYNVSVVDATNDVFWGKIEIPINFQEVAIDYLAMEFGVNDVLDKMLEGVGISEIDKKIIEKQKVR